VIPFVMMGMARFSEDFRNRLTEETFVLVDEQYLGNPEQRNESLLITINDISIAALSPDAVLLCGELSGFEQLIFESDSPLRMDHLKIGFLNFSGSVVGEGKLSVVSDMVEFKAEVQENLLENIIDFQIIPAQTMDTRDSSYRIYPSGLIRMDEKRFLFLHSSTKEIVKKSGNRLQRNFERIISMEESSLKSILRFLSLGPQIRQTYHKAFNYPYSCISMSRSLYFVMKSFGMNPVFLKKAHMYFNGEISPHYFLAFKTEGIVYLLDAAADQNIPLSKFMGMSVEMAGQSFKFFGRVSPVVVPLWIIERNLQSFLPGRFLKEDEEYKKDLSPYLRDPQGNVLYVKATDSGINAQDGLIHLNFSDQFLKLFLGEDAYGYTAYEILMSQAQEKGLKRERKENTLAIIGDLLVAVLIVFVAQILPMIAAGVLGIIHLSWAPSYLALMTLFFIIIGMGMGGGKRGRLGIFGTAISRIVATIAPAARVAAFGQIAVLSTSLSQLGVFAVPVVLGMREFKSTSRRRFLQAAVTAGAGLFANCILPPSAGAQAKIVFAPNGVYKNWNEASRAKALGNAAAAIRELKNFVQIYKSKLDPIIPAEALAELAMIARIEVLSPPEEIIQIQGKTVLQYPDLTMGLYLRTPRPGTDEPQDHSVMISEHGDVLESVDEKMIENGKFLGLQVMTLTPGTLAVPAFLTDTGKPAVKLHLWSTIIRLLLPADQEYFQTEIDFNLAVLRIYQETSPALRSQIIQTLEKQHKEFQAIYETGLHQGLAPEIFHSMVKRVELILVSLGKLTKRISPLEKIPESGPKKSSSLNQHTAASSFISMDRQGRFVFHKSHSLAPSGEMFLSALLAALLLQILPLVMAGMVFGNYGRDQVDSIFGSLEMIRLEAALFEQYQQHQ
ncbi:MAG TPA: hypothetical protein VJA17_04815, partial [Candidatus Omnitrophota bacterium]|nr:hypothetical protein [Candidatus Omnitrophota bacterium]